MPVLTELGQRLGNQLSFFDPRPAVRQENELRRNLRDKFETLLAGQQQRGFHLAEPIYSAGFWNFPTDISVSRLPQGQGFELTAIAQSDYPYGTGLRLKGNDVSIFEIASGCECFLYASPSPSFPWLVANEFVDRVVMATSENPSVWRKYREMRAREKKAFEEERALARNTPLEPY